MSGCVCFALRKTSRAVTQFYDRALKEHRLRVTQLPVLVAVSHLGSVPLAKLAPVLGMDRTTLLRNVLPLPRRRLVEAAPAPDPRWTVIPTPTSGPALPPALHP